MLDSDPRCAELDALLTDAEPYAELVHRMALLALSPHCRGDRAFAARVDLLKAKLVHNADDMANVLREAADVAQRLRAALGRRS